MELFLWLPSLFVLPFVSIVLSASKHHPLLGVIMCKEKCLLTKSCDGLAYSSWTLACYIYLQRDSIPSFEYDLHKILIRKDELVHTDVSCAPGDRILFTRQSSVHCVSDKKSKPKPQPTEKLVQARRLLLSRRKVRSKASQVYLQQDALRIQPYWHLRSMKNYFMLYSHITNSVYVAFHLKVKFVVSVSKLDTYKSLRNIHVKDIGVMVLDKERDWILICKRKFEGLFKIVGKNQTRMFKSQKMTVNSIAVCSESEIVYVAGFAATYTFTYSGKKHIIMKKRGVGTFCLDPQGVFLYFHLDNIIFRYNIFTKETLHFLHIAKGLEDMVVGRYSLYFKTDGRNIAIHNLSTKERTGKIFMEVMDNHIICLVD